MLSYSSFTGKIAVAAVVFGLGIMPNAALAIDIETSGTDAPEPIVATADNADGSDDLAFVDAASDEDVVGDQTDVGAGDDVVADSVGASGPELIDPPRSIRRNEHR